MPVTTLNGAAEIESLYVPVDGLQPAAEDDRPADDGAGAAGAAMGGGGGAVPGADRPVMAGFGGGLGLLLAALPTALPTATPATLALGITAATVFAFAIQAVALALMLRRRRTPALRLVARNTPGPRPPAGGMARSLPFPGVLAVSGVQLARAA